MVGHKFVETLLARGPGRFQITVFGEEPRLAYDRVGLSSFFDGSTAEDLSLVADGAYDDVDVFLGDRISAIDRESHKVVAASGRVVGYDTLVLATGSYPFVPPIPGNDLPGCFVYRTIEDLERIREAAAGRRVGAVVGGGLLGLEAAAALRNLGLDTRIVETAAAVPVQVDEAAGRCCAYVENRRLGAHVDAGAGSSQGLTAGARMCFVGGADSSTSSCSRPGSDRDEARPGLQARCRRAQPVAVTGLPHLDPDVYAIGECALAAGRVWGLVAPAADNESWRPGLLSGRSAAFVGGPRPSSSSSSASRLRRAATPPVPGRHLRRPAPKVYKLVDADGEQVLGRILVGDRRPTNCCSR
jgi:nitrite reductase (NADH) large subunit